MFSKQLVTRLADSDRRGSVLVVVLILVVLLSLAAYRYSESMITEYTSAQMYGRRLQTQAFADSGVDLAADLIANRTFDTTENLIHDESTFGGVSMQSGEIERDNGRFSIVAPNERDTSYKSIRFGLISESSKLDLNTLLDLEEAFAEVDEDGEDLGVTSSEFYDMLAAIPGLDNQEVVDSILDWLDEDDDPRVMGAESSYYEGLKRGYSCKNGPIESLDELLQIRGVTAEIVYGEDANRNGLLDGNEDDGEKSTPSDNEDGVLNLGLAGYCTVGTIESNLRSDGTERINLNQGLMTELFDAIAEEFDEDTAQFVVAYRLWGSKDAVLDEDGSGLTVEQEEVLQAGAKAIAGAPEGNVTRAGMDLTKPAEFEFVALFDLVDAEVEAEVNGVPVTLNSPWQTSSLAEQLPILFDTFTMTDDAFIESRIDPNQARREVLLTIPDVTEEIADGVIDSSVVDPDGNPLPDLVESHATPGWLYTEGIVDLPTMRKLEPYLTTRGDIFRVQVIGYFDQGGPFTRVEAIIDGTEAPAKIRSLRDLTNLGRGYSNVQLGLEEAEAER